MNIIAEEMYSGMLRWSDRRFQTGNNS